MKLTRIKFCDEADQRLKVLKARTGITPNLLCRIGFSISLVDPIKIKPEEFPEDSPRVIDRYTLTGQYDALFLALLRERCAQDGLPTTESTFEEHFRAHMNRGVLLLYQRVKSLADLCNLVPAAALVGTKG